MAVVHSSTNLIRPPSAPPHASSLRRLGWLGRLSPVLSIALVLLAWEAIVRAGHYRDYILPDPLSVFQRLRDAVADGTIPSNAAVTLQEAALGFAVAALIAFPAGYLLAHVPLAERLVAPLLAASQAVPALSIAPLLIIWLGNGLLPKVAVSAIIVVFPLLVTTITGLRGVGREYLEVARVFGIPWWEQVLRVELPLAAPVLLGGIKPGFTLSLTGAVVGEFLAANAGLGFLLTYSQQNLDTPLLFATLLVLGTLGITLYSIVAFLERIVSQWHG